MLKCIRDAVIIMTLFIAMMFMAMEFVNISTSSEWNDGSCKNCEVKYELRAVCGGIKF